MNAKRIVYTDHARRRLRRRHITRQDVRWLLARGIRTVIATKGPTTYWQCRGYLGRRDEANVVFIEDATSQLIVSVEWIGDEGDEVYD
jgi:hypothetical protein